MSAAGLRDLLERMREHPAFPELLKGVSAPVIQTFKEGDDPQKQFAIFACRSGARRQDEIWRQYLTSYLPSQQETP